eukprot:scaffold11685_cov38-Prasinocladus_malaysianus.AAC.1
MSSVIFSERAMTLGAIGLALFKYVEKITDPFIQRLPVESIAPLCADIGDNSSDISLALPSRLWRKTGVRAEVHWLPSSAGQRSSLLSDDWRGTLQVHTAAACIPPARQRMGQTIRSEEGCHPCHPALKGQVSKPEHLHAGNHHDVRKLCSDPQR